MICSSVNRDRFIVRLPGWADSTQIWRKFRGSGRVRKSFHESSIIVSTWGIDLVGGVTVLLQISSMTQNKLIGPQRILESHKIKVLEVLKWPAYGSKETGLSVNREPPAGQ